MIKYQEAYDYLLGLLELEDDIRWPLVKESMSKFKELVDKATPKKPIKIKTDYMESYVCPNCRHSFEGFSYCRFCGQALDRSNKDD